MTTPQVFCRPIETKRLNLSVVFSFVLIWPWKYLRIILIYIAKFGKRRVKTKKNGGNHKIKSILPETCNRVSNIYWQILMFTSYWNCSCIHLIMLWIHQNVFSTFTTFVILVIIKGNNINSSINNMNTIALKLFRFY